MLLKLMSSHDSESGDEQVHLKSAEHLLKRADFYLGSFYRGEREEYILKDGKIILDTITTPVALEKIFLEILSNACDNVIKSRKNDMDPGSIDIKMSLSSVIIRNGGRIIPIRHSKKVKGWYEAELAFGKTNTGTKFEGDGHGGGQNGIGAKGTNVMSKRFNVTIYDADKKLKYEQEWRNNMREKDLPIITEDVDEDCESYTEVKFYPDFPRFEMESFTKDEKSLFRKHALETSYNSYITVNFNDEEFKPISIRSYAGYYFKEIPKDFLTYYDWNPEFRIKKRKDGTEFSEDGHPNTEFVAFYTPDESVSVGFVNSLHMKEGGIHLDMAVRAVSKSALDKVNSDIMKLLEKYEQKEDSKKFLLNIKDVRPHISVFVSCYNVIKPEFKGGNSKLALSEKSKNHVKIELSDSDCRKISKWGLMERLKKTADDKQIKNLTEKKDAGKKLKKKYTDANYAGTNKSSGCVLCWCEGDSAEGYLNTMKEYIENGKDFYGSFPARGKGLNVMNASVLKIRSNEEIRQLVKACNIKEGVDYTIEKNFKTLRYGSVLMMADADNDGKHIVGLSLCLFYCRYPSLIKRGYVKYYKSPICRSTKGGTTMRFYEEEDYLKWRDEVRVEKGLPEDASEVEILKGWSTKYFKGLASNNEEDIRDDLSQPRIVACVYDDLTPEYMTIAFNDKFGNKRKEWVERWREAFGVEDIVTEEPISKFIKKHMTKYMRANVGRTIPCINDGLKESQRKAIHAAHVRWNPSVKNIGKLTKNENIKTKVCEFYADVITHSKYHYGDHSIQDTITKMTSDYVGSNNVPLLKGGGRVGSREAGGKDAGAARYVSCAPGELFPYIIRKEDEPILLYREIEGEKAEPFCYFPIIPISLANKMRGVGSGYSTYIPPHNPITLADWIEAKIRGRRLPELLPWFLGFKGKVSVKTGKRKKKTVDISECDDHSEHSEGREYSEGRNEHSDRDSEVEPEIEIVEKEEEKDVYIKTLCTEGSYMSGGPNSVIITELPIEVWTKDYICYLDTLIEEGTIKSRRDLSGENINIEIRGIPEEKFDPKSFKLIKTYGMDNMVLLDRFGNPKKYSNVEEIIERFYQERLDAYDRRKEHYIMEFKRSIEGLESKLAFVKAVVDGRLEVRDRLKDDIKRDAVELSLDPSHLDTIKLSGVTKDDIEKLSLKIEHTTLDMEEYKNKPITDTWIEELGEFRQAYENFLKGIEIRKRKKKNNKIKGLIAN